MNLVTDLNKIEQYSSSEFEKFLKQTSLLKLQSYKLILDDLYYNTDECTMPDSKYDLLKHFLVTNDPDYVPVIGSKIRTNSNRKTLPFYMGSIDKVTPQEQKELDRWKEKNKSISDVITEKLDGVSGLFVSKNNKQKLYTRGDGIVGADISYLLPFFSSSIPQQLPDIAVRGELIMTKSVFEKKYNSSKNARNLVAGRIGAKTVREGLNDINFIAYEIVGDSTMDKPSVQLKKLQELNFTVVTHEKITRHATTMINLDKIHDRFKKDSEFQIDGIVIQADIEYDRVTAGNPSYMFAFKKQNEDTIKETVVTDIEWNLTKWGQLIPVIVIDPVDVCGATLSRISGSNASLLIERKIGPGAIVKVTRSKDVIPFIIDDGIVCPADELLLPDSLGWEYVWDDNKTHMIISNPTKEQVREMRIKLISSFFKKMGIKFVSESTVTKLYKNGFDTLLKIVKASQSDFKNIKGLGNKSAERIVENIKNGLKNIDVANLLGSSGVFGHSLGRKRIISLFTDIPDLLSTNSTNKKKLKNRILEVEGFSDILTDKVIEHLDDAIDFIDQISPYITYKNDSRVSDALVGKKFVMSGFRSKELETNITDQGGKVVTSVSKNTTGLIVAKGGKGSSKCEKAILLGIPVYEREEFIEKFIKI